MQSRSFSRFFRQITGRRFSDYLREMRVGEACDLLQNTELPITDICFSVGFNNISWFNRCFMESKKVTPREYRRIGLGRYGPLRNFPACWLDELSRLRKESSRLRKEWNRAFRLWFRPV